ncbi:MAG: hypothetical protein PHR35_00345 [Kiritimatiellae bacterium]|nr:hypothetical protein [Kiritimatiellia bacterium]
MIQIIRLIVVTAVTGGLGWFLGKTVIQGVTTGAIRHTDSTRVCRRDQNPAVFWSLVVLFSGFVVLLGAGWVFAVIDAVGKMK